MSILPDAAAGEDKATAVLRLLVLTLSLLNWAQSNAQEPGLVDVAATAGLDFVHQNGMRGERWLVETVGAGAGLLDFDDDGRVDLWLVQGGPLDRRTGKLPVDRLYRNVSEGGRIQFEDVTRVSGVEADEYGMGIATADVDGDGDVDVFLANFGANRLFENVGGGRFRDATARAGVAGTDWSISASFADVDGDGRVDLYVANYLDYTLAGNKDCKDTSLRPTYCAPEVYPARQDRVYRNLGGFKFEDVTEAWGVDAATGPGMGVVADDFDGDGRFDWYVANDGAANLLWLNKGKRLVDGAVLAFVAFNANGAPEAGMGVDAADYDRDCDSDLIVTHLTTETNTLYVNQGGWFVDGTNAAGLAATSAAFTGFGTRWFDLELDGDLDIFVANGAVYPIEAQRKAGDAYPLRLRNQLWRNDGKRFVEVVAWPVLERREVSRSAAFGDLDNDGDTDIVVTNSNGPARVYRNEANAAWIGFDVRAARGGPALGATVSLAECSTRTVHTDGSYASASDPRVVFGLSDADAGKARGPVAATVNWPDGEARRLEGLEPGRYHRVTR